MSGVEAAVAWADTEFPVDSDNKKAIDKTHQKISALFLFIMSLIGCFFGRAPSKRC
jgi:hypothetical protein